MTAVKTGRYSWITAVKGARINANDPKTTRNPAAIIAVAASARPTAARRLGGASPSPATTNAR